MHSCGRNSKSSDLRRKERKFYVFAIWSEKMKVHASHYNTSDARGTEWNDIRVRVHFLRGYFTCRFRGVVESVVENVFIEVFLCSLRACCKKVVVAAGGGFNGYGDVRHGAFGARFGGTLTLALNEPRETIDHLIMLPFPLPESSFNCA